jgi:hypothetical protein
VTAPADDEILSGRPGHVGPRRSVALRALDRLLDLELSLRGGGRRLDRMAAAVPSRRVLVLCVYRPSSTRVDALPAALRSERHEVTLAFGATGEERVPRVTVATGLDGGKFPNLNAILAAGGLDPAGFDWTLVVDDDVVVPRALVDRLVGVCEALGFGLAQTAQTRASHAAWTVTRRRPLSLARTTRFVEIGPMFAMRRDVAAELVPFPDLRFGWGLELHWSALAERHGWRQGVIDALPVRHDEAGVASAYSQPAAVEEARAFLADRPFVRSSEANATLAVHR